MYAPGLSSHNDFCPLTPALLFVVAGPRINEHVAQQHPIPPHAGRQELQHTMLALVALPGNTHADANTHNDNADGDLVHWITGSYAPV